MDAKKVGRHSAAPTLTLDEIRRLPALITLNTAKEVVGMHKRTLQYMAARGELPGCRLVGGRYLLNTKAFLEFCGLDSAAIGDSHGED